MIEAGCFSLFYVHQNGACQQDWSTVGPVADFDAFFRAEVKNEVD